MKSLLRSQSDDDRLLADAVARFASSANEFEARRRRLAATKPDRLAIWSDLVALGVLGAAVSEDGGGLGGKPMTLGVILESLGAALVVEPVLASSISARVIQQVTNDARRERLLSDILKGEKIIVIAHQEGGDPFAAPNLAAMKTPTGYRLTGVKPAVRHGDIADVFLVSARLAGGDVALFELPKPIAGAAVLPLRLIDDAGGADLTLENVELTEEMRLDLRRNAMEVLADALEWGLTGLMAETAGIASAVNDSTFAYLAMRKQFGVPLASFQALRHRAADMVMAAEEIGAMATAALAALDQTPSPSRSRTILSASLACDVAGRLIGHEAVQFHGGMGVSDEMSISHFARRLTAIRHQFGSGDTRRARLAHLLGAFA